MLIKLYGLQRCYGMISHICIRPSDFVHIYRLKHFCMIAYELNCLIGSIKVTYYIVKDERENNVQQ